MQESTVDASITEKALQLVTESLEVSETIDYCDRATRLRTPAPASGDLHTLKLGLHLRF